MTSINVKQLAADVFAGVRFTRRSLHKMPEPAWEEHKTQQYIRNTLEGSPRADGHLKADESFVVHDCADTGLIADLILDPSYPFLALRADIDALRMQEDSGLDFASKTGGLAHACGHDAHSACLLGTARALHLLHRHGHLSHLRHNIRLIWEPAEELPPGGAKIMIKEGALKNVAAIFGFHIWTQAPTGQILLPIGPNFAYSERLVVKIIGRGGHVMNPEQAIDPLTIARAIMDEFDDLLERYSSNQDRPVLHCRVDDGGTAVNIIPESVILEASVRTKSDATHRAFHLLIPSRIIDTVSNHGGQAEFDFPEGYRPVYSDQRLMAYSRQQSRLFDDVVDQHNVMGGESFGHFAAQAPACYIFVGAGGTSEEAAQGQGPHVANHHNCGFNPDEDCLRTMVALQLQLALNWSPNILEG